MLIQDMLTGYVHEVPDHRYGGFSGYGEPVVWQPVQPQYGQVVYDGFGNPVGLPILAALAPLAAKAAGALVPMIAKAVPMIANVLPGLMRRAPASAMPESSAPIGPPPSVPMGPMSPMPFTQPMPSEAPALPLRPFEPGRPAGLPSGLLPGMPVVPGGLPYPIPLRQRRRRRRVVLRPSVLAPLRAPVSEDPIQEEPVRPASASAVSGYGYFTGYRGAGWR